MNALSWNGKGRSSFRRVIRLAGGDDDRLGGAGRDLGRDPLREANDPPARGQHEERSFLEIENAYAPMLAGVRGPVARSIRVEPERGWSA